MKIPECTWRPGRYLVTDFIMPDNIAVKEQADVMRKLAGNDDDYIKIVAAFIRDPKNFIYPLQKDGDPSSGLKFERYDNGCAINKRYSYKQEMDYSWGFPPETLIIHKGICIDTALLMTSLLIAGGISAKNCIGAVCDIKTGQDVGYHSWSQFMYRGEMCGGETTIHFDAETIIRVSGLYYPNSDWALSNGIYYRREAEWDKTGYDAIGKLGECGVAFMGMSPRILQNNVRCFGLQAALNRMERKQKDIAAWRESEAHKTKILSDVFGGGL